jgi:enoyl-CoA hydratase
MDEPVHVGVEKRDDHVAVVTLRDSDRRNAITPAMNDELVAAFDALDDDPEVGAVVLTGHGSSFCAGADLKHLGATPSQAGLQSIYGGFLRVARSPLPTLAAINGPAVGAGMNMALCCDVRLAGTSARLDTRFLRLGIHPGGGHTFMMHRIAGPQVAKAAVLFGQVFNGPEAERVGLVLQCVPDDELLSVACAMAGRAASVPSELSRRTKATIDGMAGVASHEEAITIELDVQWWSMAQPEFSERMGAMQATISQTSAPAE